VVAVEGGPEKIEEAITKVKEFSLIILQLSFFITLHYVDFLFQRGAINLPGEALKNLQTPLGPALQYVLIALLVAPLIALIYSHIILIRIVAREYKFYLSEEGEKILENVRHKYSRALRIAAYAILAYMIIYIIVTYVLA